MNCQNSADAIIQNLKDAGCDGDTIAAFMKDLGDGRMKEGCKLLAVYRRSLLEDLHKKQKQIDCLDYLVYTLEKKSKT